MEIKHNNATHNRPDGDRITDANYVFADLNAYTDQLSDEKAWDRNDRNAITVFKTSGHTIVLTAFKKGAKAPGNIVKGIISIQVMKGKVSVELGLTAADIKAGGMAIIHEGKEHSIEALEDSVMLISTILSAS